MVDPFLMEAPALRDLVVYIDQQLARSDDDHKIAYSIAGLYSLPTIDELLENRNLETVLSYAGSLEIPNGSKEAREKDWTELHAALDRLRAFVANLTP